MKIRNGFVSNSSSTSFSVFGAIVDENTEETLKERTFLSFYYGDPNSCDRNVYIGLEFEDMDKTETREEFENKIIDEINRLFPDKNLSFGVHSESFYDG